MHTSLAKKIFAVGSSVAMLLGALVPAVASAAVHADGTNVSSNGTVYFISQGAKRPYTSAGAFLSYGFNSWSGVVAASAEDLALPTGAFVPPADGSLINDKGTVYLITNGQRAGFTSAANFLGLGYAWSNVIPGDTSFMSSGALIGTTAMAHPVGTLVNQSGTVYLMTTGGKMGIPSLSVFNSWGYSFKTVAPANSYDNAIAMSSGIMPARVAGQLSPAVNGGTTPPPVYSGMNVALASDNPAAGTVITNQGLADLGHFNFNGSGTVTAVQLKRIGVSADSSLKNVFLFDGTTRLTDSASVTSGSVITFNNPNGLFSVSGSKVIAVKADLDATSGETLGVQLVSATANGGTIGGTPVSGNLMSVATATLAQAVFTNPATASGDTDPGTDVMVWQDTVSINNHDVLMSRLSLRQIGSIASTDINNFKLYVDGVQTATVANLDSNGYVTFNVSKALQTGSRTLKVTADIVGGSGRNVEMSLRGAYDVSFTDTQYGAGVQATVTGSPTSFPVDKAATFAVNAGSITAVKASSSQSTNLTVGASDQSLATYTLTAYGEPVKVETLRIGMIPTTTGSADDVTIRNVRILVNGSQVGSTTNVPAAASFAASSGTQFTTNFIVNPGTPATVEVHGDMYDSEGTNEIASGAVTKIKAVLVASTSNAVPQVSLGTKNVPDTNNVEGNLLTISSGSISLAATSSYGAQTVVSPINAYKVGSFVLSGNSTEAVNLNTIYLGFDTSTSVAAVDLSNVYLVYGGTQTTVKGTVNTTTALGNTWSINKTLGVNETMPIDVYATLNSSFNAGSTLVATVAVQGSTAQSGQTVYADSDTTDATLNSGVAGQNIAYGAGSITVSVDPSTPVSALVDDNSTVTTGAFKFAAVNDSYTITDITLTVANATAVNSVNLMDGSTLVVSKPGATTVTFSGLNIPVDINTTKVLTVQLVLGNVGAGAGTSGASLLTTLTSATARSSGSTSGAVTESPANPAGNVMYVYHAVPTVSNVALPTSLLAAGTQTLSKVSVNTSGTGTVSVDGISFNVAKNSTTATLASFSVYDADTNTVIPGTLKNTTNSVAGATPLANVFDAAGTGGLVNFVPTNEVQISGSKTFVLKATVGGTVTSGDSIVTNILNPTGTHSAPVAVTNVAAGASLIWSDLSKTSHDTTTLDWNDDFLVKNLPTDSQALQK